MGKIFYTKYKSELVIMYRFITLTSMKSVNPESNQTKMSTTPNDYIDGIKTCFRPSMNAQTLSWTLHERKEISQA